MKRQAATYAAALALAALAGCAQAPATVAPSAAAARSAAAPPVGAQPSANTEPPSARPGASPAQGFAAFPCLSYTLPCGKVATRKPVAKPLEGPLAGDAARGMRIAHARDKGNCLACHVMKGGTQPGSRGPDLSHYGSTGRSDAETFGAVYDMRTRIPDTLMPPFGTHGILDDQELRDVVAYLQASR